MLKNLQKRAKLPKIVQNKAATYKKSREKKKKKKRRGCEKLAYMQH